MVTGDVQARDAPGAEPTSSAFWKAAARPWRDVVKCQVFLADGKDFAAMNEVYAEFFGEAKPARTTVVAALRAPRRQSGNRRRGV